MHRTAIFGPPGTGKTTTLLGVVEGHLEDGVPPERIAFVSFTRKAAEEARDRAVRRFGYDRKRFKWFRTIHSLALATLELTADSVMKDADWDAVNVMLPSMLRVSAGSEFVPLHTRTQKTVGDVALFYIGKARLEGRDWETYYSVIPARVRKHELTESAYLRVGRVVNDYKSDRGLIDFTDMLELALEQSDPLNIDVAIVDEAQDLSRVQWLLLEKLFSRCTRIYMAGDDDQAIYRWAGADVTEFLARARESDELRVLERSYRLPSTVFVVAENIIGRVVGDRQQKRWQPRDDVGRVEYFSELKTVPLESPGSWYLLSRAQLHQWRIASVLRELGLSYTTHGRPNVDAGEMQGLLAYNRLHRGQPVEGREIAPLYAILRDEALVNRAARDSVDDVDPGRTYTRADLEREVGFNPGIRLPLFYGQQLLPPLTLRPQRCLLYYRYFLRCKSMGADYFAPPRHHIDTMHGVKGGEADHVVLLADTTRTISEEQSLSQIVRDDEHRVFYVGATRAKQSLWIARNALSERNDYRYPTEGLCSSALSTSSSVPSTSSAFGTS